MEGGGVWGGPLCPWCIFKCLLPFLVAICCRTTPVTPVPAAVIPPAQIQSAVPAAMIFLSRQEELLRAPTPTASTHPATHLFTDPEPADGADERNSCNDRNLPPFTLVQPVPHPSTQTTKMHRQTSAIRRETTTENPHQPTTNTDTTAKKD